MTSHLGADPDVLEDYGYGLGRPDGIRIVKYYASGRLELTEGREDFLHQLYWSPDGMLATLSGLNAQFVGTKEAFWASRGVSHELRASGPQTVYRICLRQVPRRLAALRAGAVSVDEEAARLIEAISRPACPLAVALEARVRIMDGLGLSAREFVGHHTSGPGYAMTVARAMSHDPGDQTRLDEWAARLRISVKTLQRDFLREFGMPYTTWRTKLRLRAARVLLDQSQPVTKVAHLVGYASASAFVLAFAREYGHTPGRRLPHPPRG
ncbi:AraC family transcriptional regulator [Actinocorallia sp. A-T 12471]|uniref:helix-turn-helix transcriptional regulator n=1 Tax=Actinocorallia sp. A-T 12471 TaxID=3089813 RepID=UPI0029CE70F9|nr:AraC family transcriptional regulator [Actinocorallia sp. A-T 12471]MDX6742337.1 AraC family transcriptional regulator [Actinocorallia sp. A-T 12471]